MNRPKPKLDKNILMTEEERQLSNDKKLFQTSTKAALPLSHALAYDKELPMPCDVVKNHEGKIVIHIFRRPDVDQEFGMLVVQTSLERILGGKPPEGTELLYRDEEEIKKREGLTRKVLETDSWFIELPFVTSMLMPGVDYLRDQLARTLRDVFLALK
jgi:hypothetical protein